MDINLLQRFFLYGMLINFGVILMWFAAYALGRTAIHALHGRWFPLTPAQFDAVHYGGIAAAKILTWIFFAVPWIVLTFLR